jgi:hypothetical protein
MAELFPFFGEFPEKVKARRQKYFFEHPSTSPRAPPKHRGPGKVEPNAARKADRKRPSAPENTRTVPENARETRRNRDFALPRKPILPKKIAAGQILGRICHNCGYFTIKTKQKKELFQKETS